MNENRILLLTLLAALVGGYGVGCLLLRRVVADGGCCWNEEEKW